MQEDLWNETFHHLAARSIIHDFEQMADRESEIEHGELALGCRLARAQFVTGERLLWFVMFIHGYKRHPWSDRMIPRELPLELNIILTFRKSTL